MSAPGSPSPDNPQQVPAAAFNALSVMHQLSLEAFLSKSDEELVFRILNRTIALTPYARAVLWSMEGGRPVPLGVSGKSDLDRRSPLMQSYQRLVSSLKEPQTGAVLDRSHFRDGADLWDGLLAEREQLSVVWVPLNVEGRQVAGLWLERWSEQEPWTERDVRMLGSLMVGYAAAWEKLVQRKRWTDRVRRWATKVRVAAVVLAILAVMVLVELPLRIVAPCEVIPKDPLVVAAPLDGVVEEVVVEPGEEVEEGEILFRYDPTQVQKELDVARQHVEVIRAELKRAEVEAPGSREARAKLLMLRNELKQEQIRLEAAMERQEKLVVRAPARGIALIDHPHEWRQRKVTVGQRVMALVDPAQTRLAIWLPEDDNIEFDRGEPVRIFLDVDPDRTLRAKLDYVAKHVTERPGGEPSFRAEAAWMGEADRKVVKMRIGSPGYAILYGDEPVPLGYWLFRKPYAAARAFFGL